MKKKYILAVVLPIIACAAIGGSAYAISRSNSSPFSDLVNAIAQRFNLNVSDVQEVFDEQREKQVVEQEEKRVEMQTEAEERFKEQISQAVTDGKLTQDQADKIIAKRAEIMAQRPTSLEGSTEKTREEMESEMKAQQDSLKQWLSDNNIPEEYLRCFGLNGFSHGGGRGFDGPNGDQENSNNGSN